VPTVQALPAEIRSHGFAVPLWLGWRALHRYRKAKHLEIRIKGPDVQVGALTVLPNAAQMNRSGFEGYCDIVDSTLRGWVWQPANPDQPVDIAVFVDNRFLIRATAEDLREDLRVAQIGNGAYGFALVLPPPLRDGTPHDIDVVLASRSAFVVLRR
jgi:hypothetical protein